MKAIAKYALQPVWAPIRRRIQAMINAEVTAQLGALRSPDSVTTECIARAERQQQLLVSLEEQIELLRREVKASRYSHFSPDPSWNQTPPDTPFLQYSNCQAADFYHPRFIQLCKLIDERPRFHRKQWEWIFVLHKLLASGAAKEGARGLVFGVGREPLPAVFASLGIDIMATDAPMDLPTTSSWTNTNQHSAAIEGLLYPAILPEDRLRRHVTHAYCDMNDIDKSFAGYDFNWSSCCFEHLGSLEAGMEFVVNAVERTLKVGGVAVHTTEFNASSNEVTVETGETVMYRRRDMEALVSRLRDRGHEVEEFRIGPTAHALDFCVDVPPYTGNVHLKLLLANYVATSVGVVVRRGR